MKITSRITSKLMMNIMTTLMKRLVGDLGPPPNPLGVQNGMLVTLKSGGPPMTVTGLSLHGLIQCQWFDGGKLHQARFAPSAIAPQTTDKPSKSRQNP